MASSPVPVSSPSALRSEAARFGPGFRGERHPATDRERLELTRRFVQAGEAVPPFLLSPAQWVDRRAKLFEAGTFAERALTVAPEDLARLAGGFDGPVAVLIEHAESPLEIGYVTDLSCEGAELFGTISLTAEADALVRASGAGFLSIGAAPDFSRLLEVSLVKHPRVADARLFHDDAEIVRFDAPLPPPVGGGSGPVPEDEAEIARLVRSGRLLPAEADSVRALLELGRGKFAASGGEVREILVGLLERRPMSGLFADLAPALSPDEAGASLMLPEEAAFYRRHFPDVPLQEIAKRR